MCVHVHMSRESEDRPKYFSNILFNYYIPTTAQHGTEVPELGRSK